MRNLAFGICGAALGMASILGLGLEGARHRDAMLRSDLRFPTGFEADACGTIPKGWQISSDDYAAEVISWDAARGECSLRFHEVSDDPGSNGTIYREFKGEDVAGKTLEFSAKLKCISAPGADIWVEVDRLSGEAEANKSDDVQIGGWKSVSIVTHVPADAKAVRIGIRSIGDVLIDDVAVRYQG